MRQITPQLRQALNSSASTLTRLLRVNLRNGTTYGLCMTNQDVVYDHGDGPITYTACNGFDPSAFAADVTYGVDNAEGYALISDDVPGITEEMVNTGQLDGAQWACYYVDYLAPATGSATVLDAGDLGQVRVQNGMLWIPELLSYIVRLKQTVGDVYSRTCRAEFGSPAAAPHGCGFNAAALWQPFTVATVSQETDRTFTTGGLVVNPLQPFYPGRVQWLTGHNADRLCAIESFSEDSNGQVVSLMDTLPYAIEAGDTGRMRPDCDKTWTQCTHYGNQLNFKGEPLIPVGDAAAMQIPGAQM